ncbi:phage major tail tube protein, partial [Xanthomonas campestris]
NAVQLRFAGAYQRDDTAEVDAVEVVVRGRHSEIDPGTGKSGDDTEFSVKTSASYYKLTINGTTVIEIDFVNMTEIVNGVDLLAAQRRAIGA